MRTNHIFTSVLCIALLIVSGLPSAAQQLIDKEQSGPGDTISQGVPVYFQAKVIEMAGELISASGNVCISSCRNKITATVASYNIATGEGVMRDVMYTTCTEDYPDYRMEAKEIALLSGNRIRAKKVSLYLGHFKILTLPFIRMQLGGNNRTRAIFPRPSISSEEGFAVAQRLVLANSHHLNAIADLRLTTKAGIQGEFSNVWALDGRLGDFPGRFLTYNSLRESVLVVPEESLDISSESCGTTTGGTKDRENIARLREFTVVSINQQTYNVDNAGLRVTREPEIGLRYIGKYLNLTKTEIDPRLEIYPEAIASWGRFKESPGVVDYTNRSRIALTAGANLLSFGSRTAVQPVFQYTYANYETGTNYKTTAFAIDASHIAPDGSLASLRYVRRHAAGITPFQFDRLEVNEEIEGAFLTNINRHTVGFAVGYDLGEGEIYDWSFMYGYRTDCLAGAITWDNLQKRISFDIKVLGQR